jgi:hypothetical protein
MPFYRVIKMMQEEDKEKKTGGADEVKNIPSQSGFDEIKKATEFRKLELEVGKLELERQRLEKLIKREDETYNDEKKFKHQLKFWSPIIGPIITVLVAVIGAWITINKFQTEKAEAKKKTIVNYENLVTSLRDSSKYNSVMIEIKTLNHDEEILKEIVPKLIKEYVLKGKKTASYHRTCLKSVFELLNAERKKAYVNKLDNAHLTYLKGENPKDEVYLNYLDLYEDVISENERSEACSRLNRFLNPIANSELKDKFSDHLKTGLCNM